MSVRTHRQLPLVALALALLLAVRSLLAAFVFLRQQGDDFRRFYVSAKYWPVFRLFTFGSGRAGYAAWSIASRALFILLSSRYRPAR